MLLSTRTIRSSARTSLRAAVALTLLLASVSDAALAETRSFRIDAQDASASLMEFGRQAGLQILFAYDRVKGFTTNSIDGDYEPLEAVRLLIEGTGLQVTERTTGVLVVEPRSSAPQSSSRRASDRIELEELTVTIPEVLVVGKRSLNADIARSEDDPQPYVVFDREVLQQSGAQNVESFLRDRLPMNASGLANGLRVTQAGAQSRFNLRGLGDNQTLILVDGRRTPPGPALGGAPAQSNINGIPMSAIERIEVLPATASGIYGGSATGGVINIILRQDYAGAGPTCTRTGPTSASCRSGWSA